MLGDLFKSVGSLVGSVVGLGLGTVAGVLGISKEMVEEAVDSGCETYEEIKDYWDLD